MNLYSYVRNNPLKYVDPDGHQDELPKKRGKKGNYDDEFGNTPDDPQIVVTNSGPCNCPRTNQPAPAQRQGVTPSRIAGITVDILLHPAMPDPYLRAKISSPIRRIIGQENMRNIQDLAMASVVLGPLAADVEGGIAADDMDELLELNADSSVVRGGQSELPPQGTVFSGAAGQTLEEAAAGVPHGTIRSTTVGAIESGGGKVVPKAELTRGGILNKRHVNITEGKGPSTFSKPFPNPVPKRDRVH